MCTQGLFVRWSATGRRGLGAARLAETGLVQAMELGKSAFRKTESFVQCLHERVADIDSLQREGSDRVHHAVVHCGGIVPVNFLWVGQRIVLCDVDEFNFVELARGIDGIGSCEFVSESIPAFRRRLLDE